MNMNTVNSVRFGPHAPSFEESDEFPAKEIILKINTQLTAEELEEILSSAFVELRASVKDIDSRVVVKDVKVV